VKTKQNDRFTIGLISGLIAAISMTILNYIFIFATPAKFRFSDFVGIMLFGTKPDSLGEIIVATGYHIALGGIFGVIFAYIILLITNENLPLKGLTYGTGIFTILFSLGVLFDIPTLKESPLSTIISKGVCSACYGLVLAYLLKHFSRN